MMESAIVAIIVKATLVLLAAFGLTALLRGASAAARHAVWSAALVGVIAVPALTLILPWRMDVLPSGWGALPSGAAAISPDELADTPMPTPTPTSWSTDVAKDDGQASPVATASTAGAIERDAGPATSGFFGRLARDPWRLALFAWLAVAALILLRILAGMAWMWRLARRAQPLSGPQWLLPLGRVTERLDLRTAVRVVKSDAAAMPVTCGVLRPAVVLPEESDEWSEERREAVLLHELAHVHRGDLATHLIAWVACALYWFHPLAWIAARRLRHESERACDDLVLGAGTRASEYASHLLDIVRSAGRSNAPAAAVPMAQRSSFEGRLLAILEPGVARHAMSARRKVALAGGLALVVLPLAAMAPAEMRRLEDATGEKGNWKAAGVGGDRIALDPSMVKEELGKADPDAVADGIADGIGDGIGDGVMEVDMVLPFQYRASVSSSESESDSDSESHTKTKEQKETEGRLIAALTVALDDPDVGVRLSSAQALGSLSDPRAVEALLDALRTDPDAGVRKMAAWALGEIESPAAVGGLSQAARSDESVDVRSMAVWALGEIESPEAVPALGAALRESNLEVRRMAVWALGEIESPESVEWLTPALRDDDVEIRRKAAWALGEIESPTAVSALGAALRDSDAEVRATSAWALGEIESPSGVDALRTVIRDSDVEVRRKAVWALGEIQDPSGVAPLTQALTDSDRETRKTAVWALGEIQDPSAIPALRGLLDDPDAEIRETAIWALLEMDDSSVYDVLVQLLKDEDPEVRKKAAEALGDM